MSAAESGQRAPEQIHPGQWRLEHIELVNWGTFHGHHVIEVPRRGFLLTGHSGSGKSSVVDAITAVLTPRMRASFNAAAADGNATGADRTILTYVRGAYSKGSDADSGEITTQYLRPPRDYSGREKGGTWSGILLRYSDGAGRKAHLVKLMHAKRGASAPADVKDLHLLTEEPLGLRDLEEYVKSGLKVRELKKEFSRAYVEPSHTKFAARFTRHLGITGERATLLLHRTQAAKNLGSLDDLFRDFMLDEPGTFRIADQAVEQFGELSEAHQAVVRARRQIEQLTPLETAVQEYDDALAAEQRAQRLSSSLEAFTHAWKLELTEQARGRAVLAVDEAEAFHTQADAAYSTASERERAAHAAVEQQGGARLESLKETIAARQERLSDAEGRLKRLRTRLESAGLGNLESSQEFAELQRTTQKELSEAAAAERNQQQKAEELIGRKHDAQKRIEELDRELKAMKLSRSNVGERLMSARALIAQATGIPEKSLPFAAELLQVKGEYAEWTGAVERVLRPLAPVMLVPAAHEFAVSAAADALHLGARLRFESIPAESPSPAKPQSERSLVYRVEVGESTASVQAWLRRELARRFDYPCVETSEELTRLERGVTRAGQVKRGRRRYEKDDTSKVDDPRTWVLGFSNDAKIELFLDLRRTAQEELELRTRELGAMLQERKKHQQRTQVLEEVLGLDWNSLDVASHQRSLEAAKSDRATLLAADGDLRTAQHQLEEARRAREKAAVAEREASRLLAGAQNELDELTQQITALQSQQPQAVDQATAELLRAEFAERRTQRSVTHSSIEADARRVSEALHERFRAAGSQQSAAAQRIITITTTFRKDWPAASGDLGDGVESRSGYLDLLTTLRADRLPDFEERFFRMLQEQSQQNIGQLRQMITQAPREIRRRVDPINESLRRSQFAPGRWLQIQVQEARPATVREFLADLNTIATGMLDGEDRGEAERRFEVLRRIMQALGSSETADQTWRRHCLDTRRHVKFLGLEQDAEGTVVDYYDSGQGRSGGQKQKLVVFCLAAALRYQLARDTEGIPAYGSIVIDEAFDKADARFTRMALDIFTEFGFHMILATPLKMLQVLENYVGGIALITSPDGQHSHAAPVVFDDEQLAGSRAEQKGDRSPETATPEAETAESSTGDALFEVSE